MEVKRLLFWLLLLGSPGYSNTNLLRILPECYHVGPDAYDLLRKLAVITASLAVSGFVIFLWRSILAVKPPVYQVNLQQISEKINNFMKENRELVENISTLEQKVTTSKKCLHETTKQNKMLSDEALKFKDNIKRIETTNEYLNDILQSTCARLQSVRAQNVKNRALILERGKSTESLKGAISMKTSGISEVEIALNAACVGEVGVKPGETCEQKTVYLNVEKEQSPDANAEFKDSELRGLRDKKCYLEEGKKNLKDKCDTLRAVKAKKEVEFKLLKKNVDILVEIYEQRKMAAEEKLKTKQCEQVERENQLSASEKQWKLVSEEAHKYKQQIEQMKEQLQQEEYIFRHQIALHEKKAQDNWIKGRILEGEMAEQSREAAYLKHRLKIMEEKRLQEKHRMQELMLGRPEMQHRQGRAREPIVKCDHLTSAAKPHHVMLASADSESDAAHVRNSSSFPTEDVKKDQVSVDAGGPPPFPGPLCLPYPMGCPSSPLKGCGPPALPLSWWPLGPPPPPPHLLYCKMV